MGMREPRLSAHQVGVEGSNPFTRSKIPLSVREPRKAAVYCVFGGGIRGGGKGVLGARLPSGYLRVADYSFWNSARFSDVPQGTFRRSPA